MTPIQVEVIFPLLTSLEFGCKNCSLIFDRSGLPQNYHRASADEYPEDWREDVKKLHEWMINASQLYKHRIRIQVNRCPVSARNLEADSTPLLKASRLCRGSENSAHRVGYRQIGINYR